MKFYFENFKGANSKHRILEHSADMVNKTYESEITFLKKKKIQPNTTWKPHFFKESYS